MAIEEMVLLNMTFDCEDLYKVLFQLKGSKNFYPQSASKFLKKDFLENKNGYHSYSSKETTDLILNLLYRLSKWIYKYNTTTFAR